MPRPSTRVTDEQRTLVKSLSAMGLRQEHICEMVGVRSAKTLRKHFRAELSSGMAEANAVVARVAYEMAISGRYPAMSFFWVKCQTPRAQEVEMKEQPSSYTTTLLSGFSRLSAIGVYKPLTLSSIRERIRFACSPGAVVPARENNRKRRRRGQRWKGTALREKHRPVYPGFLLLSRPLRRLSHKARPCTLPFKECVVGSPSIGPASDVILWTAKIDVD